MLAFPAVDFHHFGAKPVPTDPLSACLTFSRGGVDRLFDSAAQVARMAAEVPMSADSTTNPEVDLVAEAVVLDTSSGAQATDMEANQGEEIADKRPHTHTHTLGLYTIRIQN